MGKFPYLFIFIAGLIAGIAVMNLGRALLLENTGLLDEYTLYQMKYMTVDGNALFLYVLRERMKTVSLLAIMATTYLGLVVVGGMVIWYGMAAGMFLSAVVIRYGAKGVLFALTGVFPQYLLYVPAMIFLLIWCEQLCRIIYFGEAGPGENLRKTMPRRLLQLIIIIGVIVTGCMLESYVNPYFVSKLLKIF